MQKILNKNQKNILGLMILLVILPNFLFLLPKKSSAFWGFGDTTFDPTVAVPSNISAGSNTTSAGANVATSGTNASILGVSLNTWYGKLLEQALMAIARRALQEITKSTVNWINSGFHGSPLFLENPGSFFNDIAKSEIKNLVDTFGYDSLKFPYGKDFALNTIASYKRTLESKTAYTMSSIITNPVQLRNYQLNFNSGGWNAFLTNTQYPQNNYVGFQLTAVEELARRVQGTAQTAAGKVKDTLQYGQGFLSPQTCPSNPKYNNGVNEFQKPRFDEKKYRDDHPSSNCTDQACLDRWRDDYEAAKAKWEEDNTCKGGLKNTTPGSVVSNQITTAMGSQFRQSELGAAMGNSLSQIFDALLNKFLDEGLTALSSSINPKTTPVDNWTYNGQSLSGPGEEDWANGPDQEVILRDFRILIEGKTIVTFKKGQQLMNENGDLLVYGDESPIICKDGDKIVDSDGNTIKFCTRGEEISCKDGEKIVDKDHYEDNVGIACVGETIDGKIIDKIQYHTPGSPVLAEGGETVTLIGDKSLDSNGNTREEREYFAGDIENTIQELAVIDNPCDPTSADYQDCLYNPAINAQKPTTGLWSDYWTTTRAGAFKVNNTYIARYHPGIIQILNPLIDATQVLDWCIPGPDKGWEKRLDNEKELNKRKIDGLQGKANDGPKMRALNGVLGDLKFAVTGFKDWIDNKMSTALNGSIIYLDSIKEIDDIAQQLSDVTRSKKEKTQALVRLEVIRKGLKDMATRLANNTNPDGTPNPLTQPKKGSSDEKLLIRYKKEYDAIKSFVSSSKTLEDSKNKLQIAKDKLSQLISMDPTSLGEIAKCTEERSRSAQWRNRPMTDEITLFCDDPIKSGYSHGTVIRNDTAARINNCPYGDTSGGQGCNTPEYNFTGWFTFRNPLAIITSSPPSNDYDIYGSDLTPEHKYANLPLVNARVIVGDKKCTGICSLPGAGTFDPGGIGGENDEEVIGIRIDCKPIMNARKTDYTHAGDLTY